MDRLPKVHQEIEDLSAFEMMLSPEGVLVRSRWQT
jgi:hypothetical protein